MKLRRMLLEAIDIIGISQEDDWEIAGGVERAFALAKIRPDRNKEPILAALVDERPVGGVYASWQEDHDAEAWIFSFDVAVAPDDRKHGITGLRNTAPIGLKLIEAAIQHYDSEKDAYGDRTAMRLYVVNPKLVGVLERRYGFEIEADHGGGHAHLVRY